MRLNDGDIIRLKSHKETIKMPKKSAKILVNWKKYYENSTAVYELPNSTK